MTADNGDAAAAAHDWREVAEHAANTVIGVGTALVAAHLVPDDWAAHWAEAVAAIIAVGAVFGLHIRRALKPGP